MQPSTQNSSWPEALTDRRNVSLSGKGIKTRDYEVGAVRAVRAAYALGNHSLPHTLRSTNDNTVGLALH